MAWMASPTAAGEAAVVGVLVADVLDDDLDAGVHGLEALDGGFERGLVDVPHPHGEGLSGGEAEDGEG